MNSANDGQGCALKCWIAAGVIGALTAIILIGAAGKGIVTALILGLLAAVLLGLLFKWMFCADVPAVGASNLGANITGTSEPVAAGAAAAAAKSAPETPAPAATPSPAPQSAPAETAKTADDNVAEAAPESAADPTPEPEPAAAPAQAASEVGSVVKPSTALAGQDELAERKGTWRYEGGDKPAGAAAENPAPVAEAAVVAEEAQAAPVQDLGEDYDRDGVKEGTNEGSKPALLEAPREGGPDNLKEIKGIGPKLEKVCHSLGVYHFSQIASWSDDEVAWANANLVGFKGRVSRDEWVEQAKVLAAGGETEFSARVDKGKVY